MDFYLNTGSIFKDQNKLRTAAILFHTWSAYCLPGAGVKVGTDADVSLDIVEPRRKAGWKYASAGPRAISSSRATTWKSSLLRSSSCLSACLNTPCPRSQTRRQLCSTEWERVSHFSCFSFLRKGLASLRVN